MSSLSRTLSPRLSTLASFHRHEKVIWDIGCDHGDLGLSLDGRDGVEEIHLVDPSEDVIHNLKRQLDSYITKSKVFIQLQKGQDLIPGPESQLFFIAGMGGKEIEDILRSLCPRVKSARFIVSPHRKVLELRNWLAHSPLRLEKELLLEDAGRIYPVLALTTDPKSPVVSPFGISLWNGELGERYKRQQLESFGPHRDSLSREYCAYLKGL